MTWSSAGSGATYPTITPTGTAGVSTTLTFRLDPSSKIVYCVGQWTTPTGGVIGNLFTAVLPATFRPLSEVSLVSTSGNVMRVAVDGTVYGAATNTAATTTSSGGKYRDFYFTDTSPS